MGEGKKQEGGKRTHGTGRRKQDEFGTGSGYRNEGPNKEGPGRRRGLEGGGRKEGTG
jgi:hypothetical protein